ncbi:RNA polymerase II-associated protein [Rhodotorula diobovata]|uniref:RNA polymerase II-associated protein n=1 Tax=Rhodotorula diobovata TaxID=5288 RepID=A0A5C5FQV1_9BASI|nr:RNA polymerase II-associated protein [Rhodotorula diobovata]
MAAEGKQSKATLLVRVRYSNPLPPPPFPPRLLHVPTTPQRYAAYDFLTPIQGERELPLILDGELGIPLEYGRPAEGQDPDAEYWLGNRSAIAPPKDAPLPPQADEDAFLFEDPIPRNAAAAGPGAMPGTPARANVTDVSKKVDVSWLRKTEYLSSEAGPSRQAMQQLNGTPKKAHAVIDPLDREGRAAAVAATFAAANAPLSELRHPTKAGVTAVEAFDILPDADLWANELDLVRFGEDPAKQGPNELPRLGPDPRLPRAIMRDLSSEFPEGEGRVAYYLPSDDPNAIAYTEKRYAGEETGPEETFDFRWVRDYEIASTRPLNQEFIVSFDAGDEATEGERKGAYYAPLGGAIQLRKRRPKKGEDPRALPEGSEEQFWDGIALSLHKPLDILQQPEEIERWKLFKGEVDAPPVKDGGPAAGVDAGDAHDEAQERVGMGETQ